MTRPVTIDIHAKKKRVDGKIKYIEYVNVRGVFHEFSRILDCEGSSYASAIIEVEDGECLNVDVENIKFEDK